MRKTLSGLVSLTALVATPSTTIADVAIDLDIVANSSSTFAASAFDSNHGWQFTVNRSIIVTHLGLLDVTSHVDLDPDGFAIAHDIGLFEASGALLTSGTLSQGIVDPLIDGFRYVAVPSVSLVPDKQYVVAFHTGTYLSSAELEYMILENASYSPHPVIEFGFARAGDGLSLGLPPNAFVNVDRFGPNFLFVPEPSALTLVCLGSVFLLRWR